MSVVDVPRTDREDNFADTSSTYDGQPVDVDHLTASPYFQWKGIVDGMLAAILLTFSLPTIGLLVLLVRLTSKGPGIYRQTRIGKDGRTLMMYKIRTMRHDAEAATGAVWAEKSDPRVTPLGNVLRKLHLDEFPQLFNVLKGEMSLIGPRPERPEFVRLLTGEIPAYLNRLAVRPGITGLAQINLEPDTNLDSVRQKLVLDLEYIKHAGVFLDIRMLLCTLAHLAGLGEERAKRMMRLHREATGLNVCDPPGHGSPDFLAELGISSINNDRDLRVPAIGARHSEHRTRNRLPRLLAPPDL